MNNETSIRFSDDGRYKLIIERVPTGEGTWDHLEIEVISVSDNRTIGKTTRNYPSHAIVHFVSQDGVDYLIISENYHGGYGVMNLLTGEKVLFTPKSKEMDKYEQFWCWAAPVSHDPKSKQLVIAGCYWAAPYDHITFDFSNPMSPPYEVLKVEDEPLEDWDEDEGEDTVRLTFLVPDHCSPWP